MARLRPGARPGGADAGGAVACGVLRALLVYCCILLVHALLHRGRRVLRAC